MKKFFWYTFEDGYRECVAGYDRVEMQHMVAKHGKVVSRVPA